MIRFGVCTTVLITAWILSGVAQAGTPSVSEKAGNIICTDAKGRIKSLTADGLDAQPTLSSDGHTVAFIRTEGKATQEGQPDFTALWIGDCQTGQQSRLLGPKPANDPKTDLTSMSYPTFSLDGGYVYIMTSAWATSGAIHQVNSKTGQERFIVDSNGLSVIRNGPYRGYLIIQRHMYRNNVEGGSYDPSFIYRPDGKWKMMIPGTDNDFEDNGTDAWLKAKGWQAW